jgi:hypothetical protein
MPRLRLSPQALVITYDPFTYNPAKGRAMLTIDNAGSQPCLIAIAAIGRNRFHAWGGQPSLIFDVDMAHTGSILNAEEFKPGVLPSRSSQPIAIAPGESATPELNLVLERGQIVPPGSYGGTIEIVPYEAGGGAASFSSAVLSAGVSVDPVMSVNISGGGQFTAMDFGPLTEGAARLVYLQARSNQGYSLVASSEHNGVLKLTPRSGDGVDWSVPYLVSLNNQGAARLNMPRRVRVSGEGTSLAGSSIPIAVIMGNPAGQRAGLYKDLITIKIEASP